MKQHPRGVLPLEPWRMSPQSWNFFPTACREEAWDYLKLWPKWPHFAFNIWGESGSGKTFLGHVWQKKTSGLWVESYNIFPQPYTCYIWDDFSSEFSLDQEKDILAFYNRIQECKGFILFLTHNPLSRLTCRLQDLSSRLKSVMSVPLKKPDQDILKKLCQNHLKQWNITLSPRMIQEICLYLPRSFHKLSGILDALARLLLSLKSAPSLHTIQDFFAPSSQDLKIL